MNAFDGRIKELENVLIDNFLCYKSHTCFFLSHCHTDHMTGLDQLFSSVNRESNRHFYCSPISRLILINKYNIACENIIIDLTSPRVIKIPGNDVAPSYQITVTPIPAGHCPGSLMFLFETINQTILYTGDFRILKNDISKFKAFHSKKQVRVIDKLYFDSTFLNETYWYFPSRSETVAELLNIIKNWISKSSNHNVLLETSAFIGYEYVLLELARKLKCKIHVKDLFHDLFRNIPEVGYFLTKNCNSTKLHMFGSFDKKCLALDKKELLRIKLSAQWYKCKKGNTKQPVWKEVSSQNILMCYSTHCSCSELVDFLSYLQPKDAKPCTVAVGSTEDDTAACIRQLLSSWRNQKRDGCPVPVKTDLQLEKNYRFKLILPGCETTIFEDYEEFLPEKKKNKIAIIKPIHVGVAVSGTAHRAIYSQEIRPFLHE